MATGLCDDDLGYAVAIGHTSGQRSALHQLREESGEEGVAGAGRVADLLRRQSDDVEVAHDVACGTDHRRRSACHHRQSLIQSRPLPSVVSYRLQINNNTIKLHRHYH